MPHAFDKQIIDKGSLRTRVIPYVVLFGVGAIIFGSTFRANLDFAFSIDGNEKNVSSCYQVYCIVNQRQKSSDPVFFRYIQLQFDQYLNNQQVSLGREL